jgi:hypothetical protein
VRAISGASTSTSATAQPCSASLSAQPRPMPRAPPVTIAVCLSETVAMELSDFDFAGKRLTNTLTMRQPLFTPSNDVSHM